MVPAVETRKQTRHCIWQVAEKTFHAAHPNYSHIPVFMSYGVPPLPLQMGPTWVTWDVPCR